MAQSHNATDMRRCMTLAAAVDDIDHERMTLLGSDGTRVVVCFDGDTDNRAVMAVPTFDKLAAGECWDLLDPEDEDSVPAAAITAAYETLGGLR